MTCMTKINCSRVHHLQQCCLKVSFLLTLLENGERLGYQTLCPKDRLDTTLPSSCDCQTVCPCSPRCIETSDQQAADKRTDVTFAWIFCIVMKICYCSFAAWWLICLFLFQLVFLSIPKNFRLLPVKLCFNHHCRHPPPTIEETSRTYPITLPFLQSLTTRTRRAELKLNIVSQFWGKTKGKRDSCTEWNIFDLMEFMLQSNIYVYTQLV